jgi:hypothetical protein
MKKELLVNKLFKKEILSENDQTPFLYLKKKKSLSQNEIYKIQQISGGKK